MLTLSQGLDDQGEVEEGEEYDVEFIEAGEDAAEAFESAEEPFDLVGRRYIALSYCQGSSRLLLGGTTGMKLNSNASWRVALSS